MQENSDIVFFGTWGLLGIQCIVYASVATHIIASKKTYR
jgi:hypothetical protein